MVFDLRFDRIFYIKTKAALIKQSEEKRKEAIKQQEALRKSKQVFIFVTDV